MIIQVNMPYSFVATSQEDSTRGLNQLKKQLTATIVRFNPQGGASTDKVCLLEEDPRPGVYRVRTGLLPRIREMAPLCGLHVAGETDDRWRISKTFRPQVIEVPLRDYQERLVSAVLKHDMGVMCAATGAGKTWMAAAIIARRNVPTIYLVHTLDLLEQTQAQLHDLLKVRIGIWGGGHKDLQPVTVGMVQTLVEGKEVDAKMFGQVIVDEVHHLAANTFYEVTEKFLAPIVVGLSATPYRQDKADLMIEAGGGPITARISVSELIDAGYLARPHILFHPVQTQTGYDKLPTWMVYRRYIVENEPRNQMIANLAKQGLEEGKTVLIYVRQTKHAERIVKHLGAVDYVVLDGKDDADRRREVFGKLKSGVMRLVVSTLVREGVDIPKLDVIINAAGGADTMQIVGRALRKSGDKKYATVHDFVDHAHITLLRSSYARIERLRQEPAFRIIAEV